jgi:hypothetical protein
MEDDANPSLDPDNITRENLRRAVAKQLLFQAIEANPRAVERKTFPFKHFVEFAFKNQLTLEGWPIDICPTFPGDSQFQAEKVNRLQWREIWEAVFEKKVLRVRRWTPG